MIEAMLTAMSRRQKASNQLTSEVFHFSNSGERRTLTELPGVRSGSTGRLGAAAAE